jgi:hypothetical protein
MKFKLQVNTAENIDNILKEDEIFSMDLILDIETMSILTEEDTPYIVNQKTGEFYTLYETFIKQESAAYLASLPENSVVFNIEDQVYHKIDTKKVEISNERIVILLKNDLSRRLNEYTREEIGILLKSAILVD